MGMSRTKILASAIGLILPATLQVNTSASDVVPSDGIAFVMRDTRRVDFWTANYREVPANLRSVCWVLQSGTNYNAACRYVLKEDQIVSVTGDKENLEQWARSTNPTEKLFYRMRLSLFDDPIPMAPPFLNPSNYIAIPSSTQQIPVKDWRPTPRDQLTAATRTLQLDAKTLSDLSFGIFYGIFMNFSFENITISRALEAAWSFWDRSAQMGNTICSKQMQDDAKVLNLGSGCFKAIRVVSSKPEVEPKNFSSGVALCMIDPDQANTFLYHCSLMTMETTDHKQYVKSIVAPTMGMGGGASLVDDTGNFQLECHFPDGQLTSRLSQLRLLFKIQGRYIVGNTSNQPIQIYGYAPFQRFSNGKSGRFKIMVNEPSATATDISIQIIGHWSNENDDRTSMPVFEDKDVAEFIPIFNSALGIADSCKTNRIDLSGMFFGPH
jgi:hypothetical protein